MAEEVFTRQEGARKKRFLFQPLFLQSFSADLRSSGLCIEDKSYRNLRGVFSAVILRVTQ